MDSVEEKLKARYLIAQSWGHIFEGFGEREVRFVFDRKTGLLVSADINCGVWQPASRIQRQDVQDSLVNANPEALDRPVEYGLIEADEPPEWASARDVVRDTEKEYVNG